MITKYEETTHSLSPAVHLSYSKEMSEYLSLQLVVYWWILHYSLYVRTVMMSRCHTGLQATISLLQRQYSITMAEFKPVTLCRLFWKAAFVPLWLYGVEFTITLCALLPNTYRLSLSEGNTRTPSPMAPAGATCYVRLQSGRVDSWPLRMRKWCCCAAATADVISTTDHVENVHLYSSSDFKGDR
jgi:hypothetical protein